MNLLLLAIKSAWSRKASLLLATFSITVSLVLLLGVDTLRKEVKNSFFTTLSETDLIVGARSGPINLLLYSVFHIGNATNNMGYQAYLTLKNRPDVAWAVPLSLGDSHRGFRVVGTTADFFRYYQYGDGQKLLFREGHAFHDLYDVVLGAKVAQKYGYKVGSTIILAHGVSDSALTPKHSDKPFRVSGILKATGTPVDNSLQVSLAAIEAIHIDWHGGMQSPLKISPEMARKLIVEPETVTAVMLGLKNELMTFKVQRAINDYTKEPLLAILPGATLASLWQIMSPFEQALLAIAAMVFLAGLTGILMTLLSTLKERQYEIAVLRAVGIHGYHVVLLFVIETLFIMLLGTLFGMLILYAGLAAFSPYLAEHFGLFVQPVWPDIEQLQFIGIGWLAAVLISFIPGIAAYRNRLNKGLSS